MSTITKIPPLTPIDLDWGKVRMFRVKLEEPFGASKDGSLRFRLGTTEAKQNLSYNAQDKKTGSPFIPGRPMFYPDENPCKVGESFLMPADMSAMSMYRRLEGRIQPGPDSRAHAGFTAFGFFFAPLEEDNDTPGFTIGSERSRVCAFWNYYRMVKGDGTLHPPMTRIGPPNMPKVSITLLDRNMSEIEGIVIRPFEFWAFDDTAQYDDDPHGKDDVATILAGLTKDELDTLRELARTAKMKRAS